MFEQRSKLLNINPATAEFIGGSLFVIGLSGLAILAGAMPAIGLNGRETLFITIDLLIFLLVGGGVFAWSLRRDGLSWPGTLGVMAAMSAIISIVLYLPVWYLFTYIPESGPIF